VRVTKTAECRPAVAPGASQAAVLGQPQQQQHGSQRLAAGHGDFTSRNLCQSINQLINQSIKSNKQLTIFN